MARPKSKVERVPLNTSVAKALIEAFRSMSEETGKPLNRLIEEAMTMYLISKPK